MARDPRPPIEPNPPILAEPPPVTRAVIRDILNGITDVNVSETLQRGATNACADLIRASIGGVALNIMMFAIPRYRPMTSTLIERTLMFRLTFLCTTFGLRVSARPILGLPSL